VAGNIGDNVMWMQHARYRGFHVLGGRSRFFVTESATVNDRRYPRRNFQFPNLLKKIAECEAINSAEKHCPVQSV
jgi:hypothetical protein